MKNMNVFKKLAIFMIGFGGFVGVVFPFFVVVATKVPFNLVITPLFFTMCILAGFLVGIFNIFLARKIVGAKIQKLSSHMQYVENRLKNKAVMDSEETCDDENCYVKDISADVIGESATAFNCLVKSLSDAFKSQASLRSFTDLLSSKLELDKLAEEALAKLLEDFDAFGGAIIIEKDGEMELLSSYGITNAQNLLKNNVMEQLFKTQKSLLLDLPEEVKLDGLLLQIPPKSIMVEPIIYKGVVLGVVVLASLKVFDKEMQDNMRLFGQGLALAFKNAITHDQLQKLAAKDPLTGIFNRRFGMERFKDEYIRAVRTNQPIGIVVVDVDHFKNVNDTYGHIVGDKVLIKLTQVIKNALREGDVFMRYGGEEFIAILPGASMSDVKKIAERIRRFMEETETRHNEQVIKVTVSVGGTSFPEQDAQDYIELLDLADGYLYQAKQKGRNKVITG